LTLSPPRRSNGGRTVASVAALLVAADAILQAILGVFQPGASVLGLAQIFSPHFAILGRLISAFALVGGWSRRQIVVALLLIVVAIRFGDEWVSLPPAPAALPRIVAVQTWNLEAGSRPPSETVDLLRGQFPDVVGLQELTVETAQAIEADPLLLEHYPFRDLEGRPGVSGLGILSRFPVLESNYEVDPIRQTAVLDSRVGRLVVINAHPFPPAGVLSLGYDPSRRDADIEVIEQVVQRRLADDDPVILVGDFNTAPSEPAFERLASGLTDAHRAVGTGPGWTWRPSRLEFLGVPLLRIDLVLLGPGLRPLATSVACPPHGDHCRLDARLSRPPDTTGE
jgi:vancomycin resistance protein VanJ